MHISTSGTPCLLSLSLLPAVCAPLQGTKDMAKLLALHYLIWARVLKHAVGYLHSEAQLFEELM